MGYIQPIHRPRPVPAVPAALLTILFLITVPECISQEAGYRPGLALREDWREIPAEIPVSQEHVASADLMLKLYGPGKDSIKKSHHDRPPDDPWYIWSGLCEGNWAVALRHHSHDLDLSSYAKVRWRTKQSGMRRLHIVLKLSDGTWLVSREGDPSSSDWRVREYILADLEWYELDMEKVVETVPVKGPDLSRVEEIGFTDLMRGGRSQACSRLDWIEVYGYLVKR